MSIKECASPITGIIQEDQVFIDFGKHEGKSVLEISDTDPLFYQFMREKKELGHILIKRNKDKSFRLFMDRF